jgi:hypothetical protein
MAINDWEFITNFVDELASRADSPNTNAMKYTCSARGLKKLIPELQNEFDFSKLNYWLSHINFVLQVKGKKPEIRIWGETDGRYRIYVCADEREKHGAGYDDNIVEFDNAVPVIKKFLMMIETGIFDS